MVLSDGPEFHVGCSEIDGNSIPVRVTVQPSNVIDISEHARILRLLKETKGMVGGWGGRPPRAETTDTAITDAKYNVAGLFQ